MRSTQDGYDSTIQVTRGGAEVIQLPEPKKNRLHRYQHSAAVRTGMRIECGFPAAYRNEVESFIRRSGISGLVGFYAK